MKLSGYIVMLTCITLYIGGASAATYKSFVDLDYGFYQVVDIGTKSTTDAGSVPTNFTMVNYTNNHLTINVGDTIIWMNYDAKDWPITIVSEEGLWGSNNSYLKQNYRFFNYTFTNPGTYNVSIRESRNFRQVIIVNSIATSVSTRVIETPEVNTPVSTPVITLTDVPIIPEKTSYNTTPGFGTIGAIITILMVYKIK